MIPAHVVDEVREHTDIIAVVGANVRLRKAGTSWKGLCPFHAEKTPSFHVSAERGTCHCYGCGWHGDAIAFEREVSGSSFVEAVRGLASELGIHVSDVPERGYRTVRQRQRRAKCTTSPPTPVDERVAVLLKQMWEVVRDAPWSPAVAAWLFEMRGIGPDAAYTLGCRDFSTRRIELAELIDATPMEVLTMAGMARDGRLHSALTKTLTGDADWAAVAVPIWRLDGPHPDGWRHRLIAPRRLHPDGELVKSICPYRTALPVDLLGVGRPGRLDAPEVRCAWLSSTAPGAELVVVTEGEPDWWSTLEAVDGHAVVLSVCGSPNRWREGWPTFDDLADRGVRRVAVCVHHGARDARGRGHGEYFADAVAGGCARAGLDFTRKLTAEGRDLNDLHRAGRLRDWLADVLEVPHGE